MADQSALNRAFADYARTIARRYEIGDALYRLTDQVVDILGVDGAGVSLADRDEVLQFVSATDEQVTIVEEHQAGTGEGPCHDAYMKGEQVTSTDLTVDTRWPVYTPVAVEQGLRAAAGIPMVVEGERIGALNLYTESAREWPTDELEIAQLLADMATGYIVNARNLAESEKLASQLQHALDSRVVIEQAKGVVAERHGLSTADAFLRLRQHARSHSSRLHDVASAIIDGEMSL
ncbi:MAG TPA: GAF and ANTAR domain-containing protein [Egibacteraceae bacterium]|jgi:GAF domain-containing protein|nr:GAF and ANTAR domain-containing protein [Egibacteraceae bacterium]